MTNQYEKSPAMDDVRAVKLMEQFRSLKELRIDYYNMMKETADYIGIDLNRTPSLWEKFIYRSGIREAMYRLKHSWAALRGKTDGCDY